MIQQQFLTFEHPLNERIRTFLRSEHLFELARHRFNNLENHWDSKDCISTVIELFNLIERTEFRSELLKEIERHINSLQRLLRTPTIDHKTLDKVLKDLERSSENLKNHSSKQGYFPKDSDLLSALRQRLMLPGATCSFDIPAFYYWLHLPVRNRQAHLSSWIESLEMLEKSLALVMQLTRQSSLPTRETAIGGTFQKSLGNQSLPQLLRIVMRPDLGVYPEISASKHRVNIRFLQANFEQGKTSLAPQDIPFEFTCCMI